MLCSTKYKSEMTAFTDPKSGREIIRLTESGTNWHMYFTDNSFTAGKEEIIYFHSDTSLFEGKDLNLFSMNLQTGERTQLTEFEKYFKSVAWLTKTPDSEFLIFVGDGDLYCLSLITGECILLCRCPEGFHLGYPHISSDKKYVALAANMNPSVRASSSSENYGGFKDNFYGIKKSYLLIVRMDGGGFEIAFEDTHWMAHVQFAPGTNEYIMFCHEGPWNLVQQRIWIYNTVTRHVTPCFEQGEDDCVGHEFWTRDGLVFFDNRGKGHDGTITSDKTQAILVNPEGGEAIPHIGFADKECNILRTIDLPYYCNHYHTNSDNTKLVADAVNDIVMIDISSDTPEFEILCTHNTSWRWQQVHCHPCFSWEDDKILFASDGEREGYPQMYMIRNFA